MTRKHLFAIILVLLSGYGYGQRIDSLLTPVIHSAIQQAYPASIRIWAYDTTSRQQLSAAFSGVVVTREGHILTAALTTTPGMLYKVTFPDGKEAIAKALGKINFPETPAIPDVAMMKIISVGTWPFAVMGYASSLIVNEPCISIAYPESLDQPLPTVRFGRISQVKDEQGFIVSSCIMEPGDTGGPLFDYLGRVIGIHRAAGVSEARNYEVPVDLYRKYWTALNKAAHYTAYPVVEDQLTDDPMAAELISVPRLEDLNEALKTTAYDGICLPVTSTVKGHRQTVPGTLFSAKGKSVVIAKSSGIGGLATVTISSGEQVAATILVRDKANDLVLLVLSSRQEGGITFKDTVPVADTLGKFLLSPLPDTISIASVLGSRAFRLPKKNSAPFLGVGVATNKGPLLLTAVLPGSPAAEYGLQVGDQVFSINGIPLKTVADYDREMSKHWPGDRIFFEAGHAGERYSKEIVLGIPPQQITSDPAGMFNGGKSERRDGFEAVFSHDAVLRPDQCGGPVFDMYGHFYGINIARLSRTGCVVIPAAVVQKLITERL